MAAAGCAVALVLTACRGGGDDEQNDLEQLLEDEQAEDPPEPAPDPEPEPEPEPDPFAVPDEIDADYVDLVMNELLAVDSELLRDVLSREPGEELADEDFDVMRAIFSGPQLVDNGHNYIDLATHADQRTGFFGPDELGEIRWSTERVVEANEACTVAIGWYDLTDITAEPYPADLFVFASLSPAAPDTNTALNQTPWQLHDLNLLQTEDGPIPEEDWDRVNYEATLQTTCEAGDQP